MIDGVLNNGRKGEEQEKAQGEAHRGTPEKRPSIRERLAEAKRECGERKPPDRAQQKKPPEPVSYTHLDVYKRQSNN